MSTWGDDAEGYLEQALAGRRAVNAPTEYTVPLPGSGCQRVFTFTGTFPLTGAEWEFVMSVLAAMRPGLVKDPGPAPDADPGYWPAAAGKDGER